MRVKRGGEMKHCDFEVLKDRRQAFDRFVGTGCGVVEYRGTGESSRKAQNATSGSEIKLAGLLFLWASLPHATALTPASRRNLSRRIEDGSALSLNRGSGSVLTRSPIPQTCPLFCAWRR